MHKKLLKLLVKYFDDVLTLLHVIIKSSVKMQVKIQKVIKLKGKNVFVPVGIVPKGK